MSISVPISPYGLSSAKSLSGGRISVSLIKQLSHLSLSTNPFKTTPIRMGGGPRTYPGGVSKWQWKRMQAKKAKQLLKARLARERQIYEMRKRAELKAAISELERPWETVEKPPNLFSVGADEQLKVLADRFQKPGGLDLWSERDGPELFRPDNGLPSSRFFPKGVVHSVKPYGKIANVSSRAEASESSDSDDGLGNGPITREAKIGVPRNGKLRRIPSSLDLDEGRNLRDPGLRSSDRVVRKGKSGMRGNRRKNLSDSAEMNSGNIGSYGRSDRRNSRLGDSDGRSRRSKGYEKGENMISEVFDMSLQNDGTYGFDLEN